MADLIRRFESVWKAGRAAIAAADSSTWGQVEQMPHVTGVATKLGSLMFSPLHLQIHSGQIGLLRRSLELPPIR